jgi:hypothetical protein
MKITIEATYDKDEVSAMVLTAHVARFGNAPEGMMWVVDSTYTYRGYEVKAVDAIKDEVTE